MKNNKWIIFGILAILFLKNRNRISARTNGTGFGGGSDSY